MNHIHRLASEIPDLNPTILSHADAANDGPCFGWARPPRVPLVVVNDTMLMLRMMSVMEVSNHA